MLALLNKACLRHYHRDEFQKRGNKPIRLFLMHQMARVAHNGKAGVAHGGMIELAGVRGVPFVLSAH